MQVLISVIFLLGIVIPPRSHGCFYLGKVYGAVQQSGQVPKKGHDVLTFSFTKLFYTSPPFLRYTMMPILNSSKENSVSEQPNQISLGKCAVPRTSAK